MNLGNAWTWIKNEILTYPMWFPGMIAAVLAQGTTLGWWTLDATQTGEVTALAAAALGLAAAFLTANVGVTVIVTVLQAVGALSIGFVYNGSERVALYIGALVALLGFLGHTQNSPKYGPRGAALPAGKAVPPEHAVS